MATSTTGLNVHVTGRRVVATILDGIVLGIIFSIVRSTFGAPDVAHPSGFAMTRLSAGGSIATFIVLLAYYGLLEGLVGATVGKLVTGIRVVKEDTGRPPGIGLALLRTVLRIIDGIAGYLVGFIIVLASSRRRRLGDMAAGTLVVRS